MAIRKLMLFILCLLLAGTVYAADTKLEDMTEDTGPGTDSLIYTVDDPAGTPADRKVTIANFLEAFNYAGGVDSGGAALTGDSATGFFTTGEIEIARGGTGATDGYTIISDDVGLMSSTIIIISNDAVNWESHRSSDGSSHTFIDQDVTSGSSPTLDGTNFTGLPLTTGVTGILPVANGGTGAVDGFTIISADVGLISDTVVIMSEDIGLMSDTIVIISNDMSVVKTYSFSATVLSPDIVDTGNSAGIPLLAVPSGKFASGIKLTHLGFRADASTSTKLMFESWSDATTHNTDLEELIISTATASSDTVISVDTVTQDFIVFADLDSTDLQWLQIWGLYEAQ